MEEIDIRVAVSISLPALQPWRHSFGELKLSAEAHSFGELKLPSSQTMLISHCRRKQRSPALPLMRKRESFLVLFLFAVLADTACRVPTGWEACRPHEKSLLIRALFEPLPLYSVCSVLM